MKKILLFLLLLPVSLFAQNQGGVIIVGGVAVHQPDTSAYKVINTIQAEGTALSGNNRFYVTYLVALSKRDSLWQKSKAFYGFIGGTSASHKWNWKDMRDVDGAYRATFPNGMTHSANGITASSASFQFMKTFLNNNIVSINSNHLSVYAKNISGVTLGGYRSQNDIRTSLNTSSFSSNSQTSTALNTSLTGNSGFTILNRNSSITSYVLNKQSIIGTQNITALTNPSVQEYRFFNRNTWTGSEDAFGNDPGLYISGTISLATIGLGLTDQQAIQSSNEVTFAQGILGRK